jgi:hypothetical protein
LAKIINEIHNAWNLVTLPAPLLSLACMPARSSLGFRAGGKAVGWLLNNSLGAKERLADELCVCAQKEACDFLVPFFRYKQQVHHTC